MKTERTEAALLRRHQDLDAGRLTVVEGDDPVERIHLGRYAFAAACVQGRSVLDCATGIGYGADLLAAAGAAMVTGVDISEPALREAEGRYRRPNLAFRSIAPGPLPFADASFDVVVSFETIEHAAHAEAFLRELHRVLAPGGRLVISTPNRRFHSFGRRVPWNPHHAHEFSPGEFDRLLDGLFRTAEFRGGQEFLAVTPASIISHNWTEFRYYRLLGRPIYSAVMRRAKGLGFLLRRPAGLRTIPEADIPGRWAVVPWQAGREPYTMVSVCCKEPA